MPPAIKIERPGIMFCRATGTLRDSSGIWKLATVEMERRRERMIGGKDLILVIGVFQLANDTIAPIR